MNARADWTLRGIRDRSVRVLPTTLAGRLAVTFTVVVVVVMLLLGQYLSVTSREFYVSALADDLRHQAVLIGEVIVLAEQRGAAPDEIDAITKDLGAQLGSRITIIERDGTVLGDSMALPSAMENHGNRPEVLEALRTGEGI